MFVVPCLYVLYVVPMNAERGEAKTLLSHFVLDLVLRRRRGVGAQGQQQQGRCYLTIHLLCSCMFVFATTGYGGLDHVLASGEKVNILVMDNEVRFHACISLSVLCSRIS